MNLNQLRQLIREEIDQVVGLSSQPQNYMFFQNIKTIHQLTGEILKMDTSTVDDMLSNGHDWAVDHISSSKDDVEEVYNFLCSNQSPE